MSVVEDLSRIRVQPKQATPGCQPQHTAPVLTDLADIGHNFTGDDPIVSERFVNTVEPVKKLIAPHPERSGTVFEQ